MRYYMFNKPRGCISACRDERHKTVMDYFPEEERQGLFHVGRLDKDTEGLLIVTDDGKLCSQIAEPKYFKEKTYRFYAKGEISEGKLDALRNGVKISEKSDIKTLPARVSLLGVSNMRNIAHLLEDNPSKLRHTRLGDVKVSHIEITITEGKKHQVKKMARAVGMYIVYLERISVCGITLDGALARGEYRQLTNEELERLNITLSE